MAKGEKRSKAKRIQKADAPNTDVFGGDISADTGSMEKIRDILFGNQMRDVDKRFTRIEKALAKETEALKEDTRKRLAALETYFKKEMESLKDRLNSEINDRTDADKALMDELKKTTTGLTKKIAQVEDQLAEQATELREQILAQSKQLSTEIQEKYDLSLSDLKTTAQELDEAKLDRAALAEFLIEMAMRVSGNQDVEPLKQIEN